MRIEEVSADPGQVPKVGNIQPADRSAAAVADRFEATREPAGSTPGPAEEPVEIPEEDLRSFFSAFDNLVTVLNKGVKLRYDDDADRIIFKVINRDTGEVIRQIPPEELLDIAKKLNDFLGLLLDTEA